VSAEDLLAVEQVSVSYGRLRVLFDVDLTVAPGETLALLGTNGAGKSTLLKAVSGLVPLDGGIVRFDGQDLSGASVEDRFEAGMVHLPGGQALFPGLSVLENLRAGAFTFLPDRPRLDGRIADVLHLFPELGDRLKQRAGSLSGGEQQMVALAKALLPEPRLLIIDELSLGLAPVIVERLIAVLAQLRRDGLAMLIVEQSLNVAMSFAERAVFMEKGEVRFSGPIQELVDNGELVRAVFLGAGAA
jgi:ABC-type branched-subunit amino acid transport system ATPase component